MLYRFNQEEFVQKKQAGKPIDGGSYIPPLAFMMTSRLTMGCSIEKFVGGKAKSG